MERRRWNRDELLKVLSLYCQIPFGKMHSRNPAVVILATTISRSPSAVALKLVNFASLDPSLIDRGIRGMQNTSAADRDVWAEYYGRWEILADNTVVESPMNSEQNQNKAQPNLGANSSKPTEVVRETIQRRGQAFFRSAVLAAHGGKCCITGISSELLLRASHIVPWSQDKSMRLDPCNGLCLNALHDAAFDRGLITLTESFELLLSTRLNGHVPARLFVEMFEKHAGKIVAMPERFRPSHNALNYHRSNVFA